MIPSPHFDPAQCEHYFGVDIGGSLAKVTFFEPDESNAVDAAREFVLGSTKYGSTGTRDPALSFHWLRGTFHFLHFETRRIEGAMDLMLQHGVHSNQTPIIHATGGGAYKYSHVFREKLGLDVKKKDELACLLAGLNFLLHAVPDECYYLSDLNNPLAAVPLPFVFEKPIYPYLLVNIGSGVSILRVDSESRFERVSGTCIGGGTYWGLVRLLTRFRDFDQVMELCASGDSKKVDMLVGDIYGGDYAKFGLKASAIASAFGKMVMKETPGEGVTEADIARSLLNMIGHNIAQLAYLSAMHHKITRILFAGNFLRKNRICMGSISYAIEYWSRAQMRALFLKHEGYFGSLGAFLFQAEEED
eukprot:TRINITY_DN2312_c0_g2_i4.p1 TRINITY_DN2312_c0_g2~~TRINITY_DN2312_c0_g2_i4.p1  ORF type:complete len:360 (-),score=72.45 TRINITY_DN2312_c0_g2_i4:474-1553(-)